MALKLAKKNKVQKIVKKVTPARRTAAVARANNVIVTDLKLPTGQFVETVGRRKTATARVRLYTGEADSVINGKLISQYFAGVRQSQARYLRPFEVTGTKGKYIISAKVTGSGVAAQLEAVVHGIARALVEINGDFRALLKTESLLTRDDRMKESRKIGMGGKARRKRQSPKR